MSIDPWDAIHALKDESARAPRTYGATAAGVLGWEQDRAAELVDKMASSIFDSYCAETLGDSDEDEDHIGTLMCRCVVVGLQLGERLGFARGAEMMGGASDATPAS